MKIKFYLFHLAFLAVISSTVYAGPNGYWTLEETGTPTTAADVSGNGNNATAAGVTSSTDIPAVLSHSTNSFSFNGSTGYVSDGKLGLTGTDDFTASLWFKATSLANFDAPITKRSSSTDWQFWWNAGNSAFTFQIYSAAGALADYNTGINPSLNEWHHLVISREGTSCAVYFDATNGIPTLSEVHGYTEIKTLNNICIGNLQAGQSYGFNGLIDDVAIWNRSLTTGEVAEVALGRNPNTIEGILPPPPPSKPTGPVTVNVNFGGTVYEGTAAAPDTGTVWTTTYAPDPGSRYAGNPDIRSLQGSTGYPATLAINHNYPGSGIGTYGNPAIALFESYIHNTTTATAMTLSGLHSSRAYNLYFYAAREGINETIQIAIGAETKVLTTAGNTSNLLENVNYAVFTNVAPDAHGDITVNLGGGASTVNMLNALQVEEADPIAAVQTVPKRNFIERLRNGENLKMSFLGTSLTGGGWKWVDVFQEWLDEEFPGQTTQYNYGWGASASSEPVNIPYGLRRLRLATDANPDVVFIEFAVNDSYDAYNIPTNQARVNLEAMIDEILDGHPDREVVISTMNFGIPGSAADTDRQFLTDYFEVNREIADERNLLLIDHYWNWKKVLDEGGVAAYQALIEDFIHPGLDSYRIMHKPEFDRCLLGHDDWNESYSNQASRSLFLWHFNQEDLSGSTVTGQIGSADMILTNGASLVETCFNQGVAPSLTDGSRAYSTEAGTALATGPGSTQDMDPSLTVECIFRTGVTGTNQVLISKRSDPLGGAPHTGFSVWLGDDNRLYSSWGLGTTSAVISAAIPTASLTGSVHHIAAVWDGDVEEARLYIDGKEEVTMTVSNAVLQIDTLPLTVANSGTAPWIPLKGAVDELHITSRDDTFRTGAVINVASYTDWIWNTLDLESILTGGTDKDADPDNDGYSNAQEHLFGGDPSDDSVIPVPINIDLVSSENGLSYTRAVGEIYTIHASTNLIDWFDATTLFTLDGSPTDNGDGTETVRFARNDLSNITDRIYYYITALHLSDYIPPPVFSLSIEAFSSQFNSTYAPENTIDGSLVESTDMPRHYWLTQDGVHTGYITYDFGAAFDLTQVKIANTHNTIANDRGSKGYIVTAGTELNAGMVTNGTVLATGDLADGIGGTAPSGDAAFESVWTGTESAVRYVTVEITSSADWASNGAGLNEVEFTVDP